MDESPPPAPADKPVNKRLIAHVGAIAALVIGSLTPWITIFGIGLSGVSIHYGYVPLVAAALLALLTYLSTRTASPRSVRLTGAAAALAGVASLASVIYVGWAIRSSFADNADSNDGGFGAAFANALRPHLGFGLWLVFGAAVLTVLIAGPVALNRTYSTRTLAAIAVGTLVLGGGGVAVADQKGQADQRHAAAAAKAKAQADAKAEADRQAAEEAAAAEAQAAEDAAAAEAAAAEVADRQRYQVVLTSCASDAYGFSTDAKGKITNKSSKSRTYTIKIRMLTKSGEQVSSAEDYVSDLPAGETATWSGSGFGEGIAKCEPPTVEVSEF
jgi:hypothetical protein